MEGHPRNTYASHLGYLGRVGEQRKGGIPIKGEGQMGPLVVRQDGNARVQVDRGRVAVRKKPEDDPPRPGVLAHLKDVHLVEAVLGQDSRGSCVYVRGIQPHRKSKGSIRWHAAQFHPAGRSTQLKAVGEEPRPPGV